MEEEIIKERQYAEQLKEDVLVFDREIEHYRNEKAETKQEYFKNLVRMRHQQNQALMKHNLSEDECSFGLQINKLLNNMGQDNLNLSLQERQIALNETEVKMYQMKIKKAMITDNALQQKMMSQLYRVAYPNIREFKTQERKKRKVITHVEKREVIDLLKASEYLQNDNSEIKDFIEKVMNFEMKKDHQMSNTNRIYSLQDELARMRFESKT